MKAIVETLVVGGVGLCSECRAELASHNHCTDSAVVDQRQWGPLLYQLVHRVKTLTEVRAIEGFRGQSTRRWAQTISRKGLINQSDKKLLALITLPCLWRSCL